MKEYKIIKFSNALSGFVEYSSNKIVANSGINFTVETFWMFFKPDINTLNLA